MRERKPSPISAHHNYLVDGTITPGFVVGDPTSGEGFYFLADVVLPGESTPRISGRLFDREGRLLLEMQWNRLTRNPAQCEAQFHPGGFRVLDPQDIPLLDVTTERFANGFLTRIRAHAHDQSGSLRLESMGRGLRVYGDCRQDLVAPFVTAS